MLHDCTNASFVPTTRTRLSSTRIDLIFLPCVGHPPLTWHRGEWDMTGGCRWSGWRGRRACHRQRITPIPHSLSTTLAPRFPNLAPTFYPHPPITFCQAQPNFTCYRVIPHISRWSVVAASAERDKGDRFTKQLLSEFSG